MENILKFLVRHLVFIVMAFVSLYLIGLTIGGEPNYFAWALHAKFCFGIFANLCAVGIHAYWWENK